MNKPCILFLGFSLVGCAEANALIDLRYQLLNSSLAVQRIEQTPHQLKFEACGAVADWQHWIRQVSSDTQVIECDVRAGQQLESLCIKARIKKQKESLPN